MPAATLALRLGVLGLTVAVGLATRKLPALFPGPLGTYGGDVLYGTLWVLLLEAATFWRRTPFAATTLGLAAWAVCAVIEVSQAWPPLDPVRATRLGALVLGRGFLWSDLVCYAVGALLGVGVIREYQRAR